MFGDQYGAAPISEALKRHSLTFEEVPFTQTSKADIYGSLRALIVDRRMELPDHAELRKELHSLELELLPGGMVRVGHPSRAGARDDYADAVALLGAQLNQRNTVGIIGFDGTAHEIAI